MLHACYCNVWGTREEPHCCDPPGLCASSCARSTLIWSEYIAYRSVVRGASKLVAQDFLAVITE